MESKTTLFVMVGGTKGYAQKRQATEYTTEPADEQKRSEHNALVADQKRVVSRHCVWLTQG